jgi:hypothetical protein
LAGFCLYNFVGIGHNFCHQPYSIWYYAMDLSSFFHEEWNVSHSKFFFNTLYIFYQGLSHHAYSNSEIDLEIISFENYITFLTSQSENRYLVLFTQYIVYYFIPIGQYARHFIECLTGK